MNSNNKIIAAAIGLVVVVGTAYIFYAKPQPVQAPSTDNNQNIPSQSIVANEPVISQEYTIVQVATHKDASSCWTVIDSNVYDLTKWIPQHPGGEKAILGLCGKDGSAAFHGQHDDDK